MKNRFKKITAWLRERQRRMQIDAIESRLEELRDLEKSAWEILHGVRPEIMDLQRRLFTLTKIEEV